MNRSLVAVGIFAAALLGGGCLASGYRTKPRLAIVEGDPIVQMAPSERFRSASAPRMVPASEHPDPPSGGERVVGLDVGGGPRAYPIGLLDRVEVVNDGGSELPYVVTRCALTHVAAVYSRAVEGRVLTFENSGALWRDTLVLRDHETGTYWTVATGAALHGPLAGRRLAPIPAAFTTAETWRRAYPNARYMESGLPTSVPLLMRLYGVSPWQGISGAKTTDRRYSPKKELLSVANGSEALAFTPGELRRRRKVLATLKGEPITIEWDTRLAAPRAYSTSGGRRLERAVVPMYWFALDRHFEVIHSLPARRRDAGNRLPTRPTN